MTNEPIKLSVGGVRFETTLATLTAAPGSILASLFFEDWELPVTEDGWTLLDRNGETFHFILGYLRGALVLPNDRMKLDMLTDEAIYYGLSGLLAEIYDHDLNSREVVLHLSAESQFYVRVDQLRKERNSLLAGVAEHISAILQPNNFVLHLTWTDAHNVEETKLTGLSHFRNFEMDVEILDGPFDDMRFPRIMKPVVTDSEQPAKSLQTRSYILKCAVQTMVHYLKSGELQIPTSMKTLREFVNSDFAVMQTDLTWDDLQKSFSERDYLQDLLIPAVVSVAKYFNLQKLKRLAEENLGELTSLV